MTPHPKQNAITAEILAALRVHDRRTAPQLKAVSSVAASVDDIRHAARDLLQSGRIVSDKRGGATGYRLSAPERARGQQAAS